MNFRKLIITSLVGSIGIAVLSLSLSIAWYATSENLYIDTLVMTVKGQQQLLISTTGEDGTFVDSIKFHYDDEDSQLKDTGLFQPVSSMFKSKWLEDDLKTEPELYIYTNFAVDENFAPKEEAAQWGYYSQHLYLYSSSKVNATLSAEDFKITELEDRNSEYAGQLMRQKSVMDKYHEEHPDYSNADIYEDIMAKLANLKKCMRVGIYDISENKFHILDPYKEGDTLLGGRADLFMNKYYDSYPIKATGEAYEVIYGEVKNRDKAIYLPASDDDSAAPSEYTSFNSRTKAGVKAFDLEASQENGLEIKKEDSYSLQTVEEEMLIHLDGGEPKEFVLMFYMEGWDLDCTNQHMGSNFNLNLEFKVSEEKQ